MADDPRVQQLLEELLESNATPEAVCSSCVELLPVVRARWRQFCFALDEVDALFPPLDGASAKNTIPLADTTALPSIPGYEMQAVLGVGGMGVVFRARHIRLNRLVAIKMALAGLYAGPHERERFQREAEAVAALRHPNVVQIHDIADVDGRPYFTMEYIDGGTLGQQLTGAPWEPRKAAGLIATLAVAVHAAHECCIVHRDLKPGNIFLTADGTPKIGDFGLARRLDGEAGITRTGTAVGTASYMAPEQAGETTTVIGPAADVYALGSILYELLTGRPPFTAARADVTLFQVLTRDPDPPSRRNAKVPRDLETVCLKCLQKDPRQRYTAAAALGDDLDRFLRGEAIAARPEGRLGRLVRRVRRRPVLSAAVAIAALSTLALVGGGAWTLSERAAAKREAAADMAATERSADGDLTEMADALRNSSWPQARTALERAKGRLGDRDSAELRRRIDQGTRELTCADRLDAIRLGLSDSADGRINYARCDRAYEDEFRNVGLGAVHDDPTVVAARIKASNIAIPLVAALDHWSSIAEGQPRKEWLLDVARRAEPKPTAWRDRARDPRVRADLAALIKVIETASVAEQSVSLLLSLHLQLPHTSQHSIPFLRRIHRAHPDDFWANLTFGYVLTLQGKPAEAIRYYQAAIAIRPRVAAGYHGLGVAFVALSRDGSSHHLPEAVELFQRAVDIDPTCSASRVNLGYALFAVDRCDEAIREFRWVLDREPDAPLVNAQLGICLAVKGRFGEAEAALRRAARLAPKHLDIQKELRGFLMARGRAEDARRAWQEALAADPLEHNSWYGYAELCLFLGDEGEYRRARQLLLARFAKSTDTYIAERVGRACLLLPATGDELNQAVALAERAASADRTKFRGAIPYFQFVWGLAEYRRGQFDRAMAVMRGDASRVLGPSPRLVLAMALHRSGQVAEARKTLADAVLNHDWRANQVRDQDDWIRHILRREAEGLILPNLQAFLDGKYEPRDNDERIALLGICQFTDRSLPLARLYADAFAANPLLAEDFRAGHRYRAACAAALTGFGRGEDAARLTETEQLRWRAQARMWLRADLVAWGKALDSDPAATRNLARQQLTQWQNDRDLAELREPNELAKLPADERKDCLALWAELGVILDRWKIAK